MDPLRVNGRASGTTLIHHIWSTKEVMIGKVTVEKVTVDMIRLRILNDAEK